SAASGLRRAGLRVDDILGGWRWGPAPTITGSGHGGTRRCPPQTLALVCACRRVAAGCGGRPADPPTAPGAAGCSCALPPDIDAGTTGTAGDRRVCRQ